MSGTGSGLPKRLFETEAGYRARVERVSKVTPDQRAAKLAEVQAKIQAGRRFEVPWEETQRRLAETAQARAERQAVKDRYEREERIFGPVLRGLTTVADALANVPGNPATTLYKAFAPPGSEHSGGTVWRSGRHVSRLRLPTP